MHYETIHRNQWYWDEHAGWLLAWLVGEAFVSPMHIYKLLQMHLKLRAWDFAGGSVGKTQHF